MNKVRPIRPAVTVMLLRGAGGLHAQAKQLLRLAIERGVRQQAKRRHQAHTRAGKAIG